jgi:hypothetical protein
MSTSGSAAAVLIACLAMLATADAADYRELNTDRDAFTPATTTATLGHVICETSYVWIDNRGTPPTNSFPELLVRIGGGERFEWRIGANYEQGSGGSVVSAVEVGEAPFGDELASEASVLYGFKLRTTEQDGWIPRSAVIVEGFTPVAGDVWGTEPVASYAFGWESASLLRFDTAIRYAYADSEAGRFDRWMPSVVLRIPVTPRFEMHAEWFGSWTQGLPDDSVRHFAGPGSHFMITSNLELGCRMGWGLTNDAARYFVDVGLGYAY